MADPHDTAIWTHVEALIQGTLDPLFGPVFQHTIQTVPGSDKSHVATVFATEVFEQTGNRARPLYLMLSKEAIAERLKWLKHDHKDHLWQKWEGHLDTCATKRYTNKGFASSAGCNCNRGTLPSERKATIAPIDYIFDDIPVRETYNRQLTDFRLWIIDELDLQRVLGKVSVSYEELRLAAQAYPDDAVKTLCGSLLQLMADLPLGARYQPEHLCGRDLLLALDANLTTQGTSLEELIDKLPAPEGLPDKPWVATSPLPYNFPPKLVYLIASEYRRSDQGRIEFNPLIHVVADEHGKTQLSLRWRKVFPHSRVSLSPFEQGQLVDVVPASVMVLDATADPYLTSMVFPGMTWFAEDRDWPRNAHVFQWADTTVTRNDLKLQGAVTASKARQSWYKRIADALLENGHAANTTIGVITFQDIEDEARDYLNDRGFTNVTTLNYFGQRGSNAMEYHKVLVLLGCPIPNSDAFKEEAEAFFSDDDGRLDYTWDGQMADHLTMVDGSTHAVTTKGVAGDDRAVAYHNQKCQAELYQAIHRIRPYRRSDDLYVYVFTNMPIPGVQVEGLLQDAKRVELGGRERLAVAFIIGRLQAGQGCTVPEVAKHLLSVEGSIDDKKATDKMRQWVLRKKAGLATLTGTEVTKHGNTTVFATPAATI